MLDLTTYGLTRRLEDKFLSLIKSDQFIGRVTRIERDWDLVATKDGIIRCERRLSATLGIVEVAVGDWVSVKVDEEQTPPAPVICELLLRRNEVKRKRSSAGEARAQIIASNVDICCIVVGLDSGLNANRLARSLIMVLDSQAQPILVLTKADEASPRKLEKTMKLAKHVSESLEVFAINAKDQTSIAPLKKILTQTDQTTALVGASGAGKSTLMNSLSGLEVAVTQQVRKGDFRGRHTTTFKELLPLSSGSVIIDTPGIRSVGLWQADQGIEAYFWPIYEAAANCAYSRCAHNNEVGCGVTAAISEGTFDQGFLDLWRDLDKESSETYGLPG